MKKQLLLVSSVITLVIGGTAVLSTLSMVPEDRTFSLHADGRELDGNEYDYWCNSWSQPGHVYFHYNRGDKTDYNDFCLWLWDDFTDTDGTLWAYGGDTKVSDTLSLIPMSTHWMYESEVGLGASSEVYKDKYGVICDVDLTKALVNGKVKTGKEPEPASYDNCDDLGFLFPKVGSMDGTSHWKSDGGKDNDIYDWKEEENWRKIDGGTCEHIFLASGALDTWSYYIGNGAPEVKVNPMDKDTTGQYSSKVDTITDTYGISTTSEAFKKLGVGYQIFVASFRDSDGDGTGDIRGIIDSLDYLQDLGAQVLWLTPIQQSDSYHGYDISDYYAVNKKFGTIDDYRELIFKAHQKGMKVLMDLVLNHTSKKNVWFTKSQWGVNSGAPGAETDDTGINWRNVYTWKYATDKVWQAKRTPDKKGIAEPVQYEKIPVSEQAADTYGPSWYSDGESNYYYYGKFGSGMPEINYENKDTRKLVTDMAKYWLSFGLDGYRLDAVKHIYMKDEVDDTGNDIIITDVGSKEAYDEEKGMRISQPYDYSSDLTKNVAFWKEFSNEIKKVYPNCFLVGENFDGWGTRTAPYYNGLDSQFDFANYYHIASWIYHGNAGGPTTGLYASKELSETYDTFRSTTPLPLDGQGITVPGGGRPDCINGAFTSNHDVMRAINQVNGTGDATSTVALEKVTGTKEQVGRAKVHGAITMLLPGISWIYYGDELGMSSNTDTHIAKYGNENCTDIWYRQPMMWNDDAVRPNYSYGQYKFEYDSYNSSLFAAGKGIDYENGVVSTTNEMYNYYKGLAHLKQLYPTDAKVSFQNGENILIMNIWSDTHPGKSFKIYIHCGFNDNGYTLDPGNDFNPTPVAQIGTSGKSAGSNLGGASDYYSVVAFERK